jgi:hypothetical protein
MAIAITRSGIGKIYRFSTLKIADAHPLIQYGDPVMDDSDDLREMLLPEECIRLAMKIGETEAAQELEGVSISEFLRDKRHSRTFWGVLSRCAQVPSSDPEDIMREIVTDRVATRRMTITVRGQNMSKKDKHVEPKTKDTEEVVSETPVDTVEKDPMEKLVEETVVKAEATAPVEGTGEVSPPKKVIPKDPKYAETAIIHMLANKQGVAYGAENNPKKPGSASHDRFARYVHGMSVGEALKAGVTRGDLDHDASKGFIAIA